MIASVAVDSEIIDFMDMKRSHRKTRLLLTPKVVPTLANLRRAIGKKFFALTNQDYKLRYRISRSTDTDLKPMKDDLDLANAVRTCEEMQSSIQLFVVVNPGVFPPVSVAPSATTMQGIASEGEMDINSNSNNSRAFSKLHPAVLAMRAARLDPAESVGYVMVSFYGFHSIGDPRDFAHKLGRLWKPFQPLGRVRRKCCY